MIHIAQFLKSSRYLQLPRYLTSKISQMEVEDRGAVRLIFLNRPDKLNALTTGIAKQILSLLHEVDNDPNLKVTVLTGKGKAFCAGADLEEMSKWTYEEASRDQKFFDMIKINEIQKPFIGAVNGVALGGGCELAMLCDILIASEKATFSQPETNLALIPGMGGTQRLTRAVGKSKAMEMILTGDIAGLSAQEALSYGLVSKVVPHGTELDEALCIAEKVAKKSIPAIIKAKKCITLAFEQGLTDALKNEAKEFWSCFALEDTKEGINAYLNKREPNYKDK